MKPVVGMRVKAVCDVDDLKEGYTGTILSIPNDSIVGVEWDLYINGHDLTHLGKVLRPCKKGHGWFVYNSEVGYESFEDYINELNKGE